MGGFPPRYTTYFAMDRIFGSVIFADIGPFTLVPIGVISPFTNITALSAHCLWPSRFVLTIIPFATSPFWSVVDVVLIIDIAIRSPIVPAFVPGFRTFIHRPCMAPLLSIMFTLLNRPIMLILEVFLIGTFLTFTHFST